jgi:hypothetical protein
MGLARRRPIGDNCFRWPEFGVTSYWNHPLARAFNGMEPSTDMQIKLRIGYALSDRLVPICSAIVETTKRMTGLIDELPAVALRRC